MCLFNVILRAQKKSEICMSLPVKTVATYTGNCYDNIHTVGLKISRRNVPLVILMMPFVGLNF